MLKDIVEVQPTRDYRLHLRFEDGREGEVDVAGLIQFEGIFAPLKDRAEFLKVTVDPELGTICWPNGADLDPDTLYAKVTGEELAIWQPLEGNGSRFCQQLSGEAKVAVTFAEIKQEFDQTFGYVRQDIKAILDTNPNLHYTLGLLICCACEMLAEQKSLKEHEVFTSLLPNTKPYPLIGETMFKALRNGLAHGFRPKTLVGSHQWRFRIGHQGLIVSVTEGKPNWVELNVKALNERVRAKIDAYEEELRQSPSARLEFRKRSTSREVNKQIPAREAEAWKSLLTNKRPGH